MILKEKNYKKSFASAFTLIEMVIVIAVIGILMGIAFNGISSVQQNARDTRRISDLRKAQTQLELFFNRCGHYPVDAVTTCGNADVGARSMNWSNLTTALGLVVNQNEVPDDPIKNKQGQGSYQYAFKEDGLGYIIGANTERVGSNLDVTGTLGGINCDTYYCMSS
jgi:prepilin-type N-terminal cleavage/methylation domain-containing protein